MRNTFLFFVLLVKLLLSQSEAKADLLRSIPNLVHLHIARERGWSGSVASEIPEASFAGFDNSDVGRWFTVAIGPEFVNMRGGHSVAFTGQLSPDRCRAIHPPVPLVFQSWDSKQSLYTAQTRRLNRCVALRVRDVAGIRPADQHPACQIEKVSDTEVIAHGGLCYFRINPGSFFRVSYAVDKACSQTRQPDDREATDIFATSSFYISGDPSGRSSLLKPLGSGALRFSVEPSPQAALLSVDMGDGAPRWPVRAYPDVHMGDLVVEGLGADTRMTSQIYLKNACPDGADAHCHAALPIGVQYTLMEVRDDSGTQLMDRWYSGGVSPVGWDGFFSAQRNLTNASLIAGRRYRLEADLTYLSLYHRLFKEGFRNYLIQRGQWSINSDAPLLPLPAIALIPGLVAYQPNAPLPVTSHLTPGGKLDFQLELNQLRALLTGVDWPPYYEEMCGDQGCARAQGGRAQLRVGVDFRFRGFDAANSKIDQLNVWRSSSFSSEYNKTVDHLFQAECK